MEHRYRTINKVHHYGTWTYKEHDNVVVIAPETLYGGELMVATSSLGGKPIYFFHVYARVNFIFNIIQILHKMFMDSKWFKQIVYTLQGLLSWYSPADHVLDLRMSSKSNIDNNLRHIIWTVLPKLPSRHSV